MDVCRHVCVKRAINALFLPTIYGIAVWEPKWVPTKIHTLAIRAVINLFHSFVTFFHGRFFRFECFLVASLFVCLSVGAGRRRAVVAALSRISAIYVLISC